ADKDLDIEVGAQVAAEHLRYDIALRRKMVRGNLRLIQNGQLPSNINVRRGYHEDDHYNHKKPKTKNQKRLMGIPNALPIQRKRPTKLAGLS
ncbi:hypothetical protein, partial [Yoonia sp.]|uniref:hypothetical protein n=1 Tax=Yoonia sp. TaxID=2212373 RepID=UPI0023851249